MRPKGPDLPLSELMNTMEPIVHRLTVRNLHEAKRELEAVGADPASHPIMAPKMCHVLIKVKDVDVKAANIIKQEMLAKGGEAAVAQWASTFTKPTTDVIMIGTVKQFRRVLKNFRIQPHGLKRLVEPIERILGHYEPNKQVLTCGRYELPLGERTLLMGILNVTPDSFSEPGLFLDKNKAIEHARLMVDQGADIIDIGGESTRPGAEPVAADEEKRRVIPVIEALAGQLNVPISIDTSKADVAAAALEAGAAIVNDVTALAGDPAMASVCAESDAGLILMHMRGKPRTMQDNPLYTDLISEITGFLSERIGVAVNAGVAREKILVDPGIGFGKTPGHNLEIIKRLAELKSLGSPLVLGVSRKSTIGMVLGGLPVDERLEGTAAAVAIGILNGADIVRVHDVEVMARVARMTDAIIKGDDWHG